MGRRHVVSTLPEEEQDWVVRRLLDGDTDQEIARAYAKDFPGKNRLSKSAIARWRDAAGAELADRYRVARAQAKQLLEDLKADPQADRLKVVFDSLEDRLLTATMKLDAKTLIKLRLDEEKRRQKDREIELKEKQLELEREKLRGAAIDRLQLGREMLNDLLEYLGADAEGLKFFKKIVKPFTQFLADKHAEGTD